VSAASWLQGNPHPRERASPRAAAATMAEPRTSCGAWPQGRTTAVDRLTVRHPDLLGDGRRCCVASHPLACHGAGVAIHCGVCRFTLANLVPPKRCQSAANLTHHHYSIHPSAWPSLTTITCTARTLAATLTASRPALAGCLPHCSGMARALSHVHERHRLAEATLDLVSTLRCTRSCETRPCSSRRHRLS
jgi:hypothetical protein